jgi:hypothetical protein
MTSSVRADNGGVDLFDALTSVASPGLRTRRPRSPAENLAGAIAFLILPLIEVAITVIWHVKDPTLVCIVLPLVFGGLAYFACRTLVRIRTSLGLALGCAWLCFCWGCCVFVMHLLTWSY